MRNKKLKQLKTVQSRRGIAMEMAILFLVVVVALSGLLVSVSLIRSNRQANADERFDRLMTLDQIGEGFCLRRGEYQLPDELAQEYDVAVSDVGRTLNVYAKENPEESIFTVHLEQISDDQYMVTEWSYGE